MEEIKEYVATRLSDAWDISVDADDINGGFVTVTATNGSKKLSFRLNMAEKKMWALSIDLWIEKLLSDCAISANDSEW